MQEYIHHIRKLCQRIVSAASYNHTGAFLGDILNRVKLRQKNFMIQRHLRKGGRGVSQGIGIHHQGIEKAVGRLLIMIFKNLLAEPTVLSRSLQQCLVIKGNLQFFRKLLSNIVTAASILTSNGNNGV